MVALSAVCVGSSVVQIARTNAVKSDVIADIFTWIEFAIVVRVIPISPVAILVARPPDSLRDRRNLIEALVAEVLEELAGVMGCHECCSYGILSSDHSVESSPRSFCGVVTTLINHAIVVIIDSIGRNPRAFQECPAAHRRGSTSKACSGQRPRIGESLQRVKIPDLIFRGGGRRLVAIGTVEVKTKHSSGQIIIGDIRDIIFKEDCIAGLLIIPLICPDFSPQAQTAPRVTALDCNIVRAEIANIVAGTWIEPHSQRRRRRILRYEVFLVLSIICSPIGLQIGVLHASAKPTVPLTWPFRFQTTRRPSIRWP